MNDRKTYTAAELNSAEKLMQILSSIPEEKRTILVMMANSFMAGMEAKEYMKKHREQNDENGKDCEGIFR